LHNQESKDKMITTKFLSKSNEIGGLDYLNVLTTSKKTSLSKTIYQLSKDKKELINTFPSLYVAASYFKSDRKTIRKYLNSNNLFGNQWYLTIDLNFDSEQQQYNINNSNLEWSSLTLVYQYLIDKESIKLINTFSSVANAALYFEVTPMTIRRYLKSQKIFKDHYILNKDGSLNNSK
jgi:NUMOD1 domain